MAEQARRGYPVVTTATAATVALRPATVSDVPWLDTWLRAAAASVDVDLNDIAAWLTVVRARIIMRDGADVGLVAYRLHPSNRSAALVELVATPSEEARKGAGMAAAALLEDELRRARVRLIYAPAPARHGISMYFWIRLGYRPLLRTAWPFERAGVAWLVRAI